MHGDGTVEVSEAEFRARMTSSRTTNHPAHWPPDVREISLEGLSILGLDSKGQLYLDGDPVYTVRRWGKAERGIAIVGVAAALLGAAAALVSAVLDVRSSQQLYTSDIKHVELADGQRNAVPLDLIVQVAGERADNAGAVGVSFPHPTASNQIMGAGGLPIQLGLTGLSETAEGYLVSGYFGNLSSAVIGKCTADLVLSKGGADTYAERVSFAPLFGPGAVEDYTLSIETDYGDAETATLSRVRCASVFYPDTENFTPPEPG